MSDHPIIWAMAKAHYEALTQGPSKSFVGDYPPFDEQTQWRKDQFYDAMWAALAELRVPTDDMLHAAFVKMNETPSGTWKAMKAAAASPEYIFTAKEVPRFTAMIDKLREVK